MRPTFAAAFAALALLLPSDHAQARRHQYLAVSLQVTDFCGDRYCGEIATVVPSRYRGIYRIRGTVYPAKNPGSNRKAKERPISISVPLPRYKPALLDAEPHSFDLPAVLTAFKAPIGSFCAAGRNILHAFRSMLAAIVEPVRPGFVAIQTASGKRAVVAVSAASRFVGFLRDLEATGYRINEIGGYTYRRIAGSRRLSKHAFGNAIDVNQDARDVVSVPMDRKLVSKLALKNGLCSGGDWYSDRRGPDLGHFEVCGRKPTHLVELEPVVPTARELAVWKVGIASTFYDRDIACSSSRINPYKVEGIAHKTLACGTIVTVKNLANGRSWTGPVVDKGPCTTVRCQAGKTAAYRRAKKRDFDLLPIVARKIGSHGLAKVAVAVLR